MFTFLRYLLFSTLCALLILQQPAYSRISQSPILKQEPDLIPWESSKWNAAIVCPGGSIGFGLELKFANDSIKAFLINGPERIEVPQVKIVAKDLELLIEHYDSSLKLTRVDNANLKGVWKKRRGPREVLSMEVTARISSPADQQTEPLKHEVPRIETSQELLGRWAVKFESSEDPAA